MPWHHENCIIELRYQKKDVRGYWCHTHNQWAYEFADKTIYVFADELEDSET